MMTDTRDRFERIAEQVESWRVELRVPGATFGIRVNGQVSSGGVGVTSVDHPLPVTDETIFQIGSITKTVTATAMMRLVEQGMLDLQAPVRDYLPAFRVSVPGVSANVKVWQLLTHVAGWTGDVFTDTGNSDDAAERYVAGMAEFEQLAPLGQIFSYNNASFCVAGRIIEVITGATFEAAIHDLVFEPLEMARSFFFPHEVMLHRFAVGHQVSESKTKVLSPWAIPRGMNAAGGIGCHVHDLLRYGAYHLGEGPPLLKRESLREMHRRHVRGMPYLGWCGLAWMRSEYSGKTMLWHTGGTNGQNAVLTVVPEDGLALAMMTNGDAGHALHDRYNKAVLAEFCHIQIPEPQVIETSPHDLAQYVGRYKGTMREIELRLDGGALVAEIRLRGGMPSDREETEIPPAEVARCGDDQFFVLDGADKGTRADFIRDVTGGITHLRFGSRINPRQ